MSTDMTTTTTLAAANAPLVPPTKQLTAADVTELQRQLAWHIWWHHRMPETSNPRTIDKTPERFNVGTYAMECLIEAHVIAESYLQNSSTTVPSVPAPQSSSVRYAERASLYETVWASLVHQESATAGQEVRRFIESTLNMLQSNEHSHLIKDLYQSIEFTPHKRVAYEQLAPHMMHRLQKLYFASMFMSVAFLAASENFYTNTAMRGRPLSECVGNATVERMRMVYADALGSFKEGCKELELALDRPAKKEGFETGGGGGHHHQHQHSTSQVADALTDHDLAYLTQRIESEMSKEKTAAEEKKRHSKHLLASILSPRKPTVVSKSRRSQSVSIQPGTNLAAAAQVAMPRWKGSSKKDGAAVTKGRSDRITPLEKPVMIPTAPTTAPVGALDSVEWLLHADLFARHCWKELEVGGVEKLALGAHILIKSYAPPAEGPTLRTDMQILLARLSLPLLRSNLIVSAFEALSLKTVQFDAEIRKLLAAKYVGTTQGYLKATPQDHLRAHQLCVLIYAISGISTRRTELQSKLMLGAQSVEANGQLDTYRQCIDELTDIQFELNAAFTGRMTRTGTLYHTKKRAVSLPTVESEDHLLDSSSS